MKSNEYTVVPITTLDASVSNANIVARCSVIFDAPLSFEKLQETWETTVKALPILQARVRRSNSAPSGLDYHVPTPEAMARHLEKQLRAPDHLKDLFCLDQSYRSITEYCPGLGVGPDAPSRSNGIFIADAADSKDQERCTSYNAYKTMKELLSGDRPILTAQVTRFKDATLITTSCNHVIGDLFCIKALFKAWESTLHGKPLPSFEELGRDPFGAYGPGGGLANKEMASASPPLPPGWLVYGLFDKIRFMSRMLWECYVHRPESSISQKYIFISDAEQKSLMREAVRDLAKLEERRKQQGIEKNGPLTVGKSNVLYAWLLKQNHAHLAPEQRTTPVTVVNARAKPPVGMTAGSDDFPKNDWYGAAITIALPSLKAGDLMSMPLGELALHVREGTEAGSTPENLRQLLSFTLHNNLWAKPSGLLLGPGPPDHHWSGLSDWRLIRLGDVDLTPARLDRGSQRVSACGYNAHMVTPGTQRNCWVSLGDAGGGTWILGITGDAEWQNVRGLGKHTHLSRLKSKL